MRYDEKKLIKSHLFYLIRSLLINYHPLPAPNPAARSCFLGNNMVIATSRIFRSAVVDTSGQLPALIASVTEKAKGGVNPTVHVQAASKTTFLTIL